MVVPGYAAGEPPKRWADHEGQPEEVEEGEGGERAVRGQCSPRGGEDGKRDQAHCRRPNVEDGGVDGVEGGGAALVLDLDSARADNLR